MPTDHNSGNAVSIQLYSTIRKYSKLSMYVKYAIFIKKTFLRILEIVFL